MTPKVFVSHASEDKDRFVLNFATRLREKGIDAWLDKWEMHPGDSLVDKIFEEGIKDATAVIIVISSASVLKPWVKEELNAAMVKRINKGSKLIPVVIDDCEVPASLQSTLWERVNDLKSYDTSFDRIVSSIFGISDKPPIGAAPVYVNSSVASFGGLNKIDSHVLKLSCETALQNGSNFMNPTKIFFVNDKPIIPQDDLDDAFKMLDKNGYIKITRLLGSGFSPYQITTNGLSLYFQDFLTGYEDKVKYVAAAIVNKKINDSSSIAAETGESIFMVMHILDVLHESGHIDQVKLLGGISHINNISPTLKRMLAG